MSETQDPIKATGFNGNAQRAAAAAKIVEAIAVAEESGKALEVAEEAEARAAEAAEAASNAAEADVNDTAPDSGPAELTPAQKAAATRKRNAEKKAAEEAAKGLLDD